MKPSPYNPIHPGEVIRQELNNRGATIQDAANSIGISRKNLSLIVNGHASVTVEMSALLSKLLGPSPKFWLSLQNNYDLSKINLEKIKIKQLPKQS